MKSNLQRYRLALLTTCKAINVEATRMLYSTAVLRVHLSGARKPESPMPSTQNLKNIQHLELLIVAESQAAINYLKYLTHVKNAKRCHVRVVCRFQCQRIFHGIWKREEGFNLPNPEDRLGFCARFVTALTNFLSGFRTVVFSYGLLREAGEGWGGCVPTLRVNGLVEGPPYHEMSLDLLAYELSHHYDGFISPKMANRTVDGDKARRTVVRRKKTQVAFGEALRDLSITTSGIHNHG